MKSSSGSNFVLKIILKIAICIPNYNSASEMFVCLNVPSFSELLRNIYISEVDYWHPTTVLYLVCILQLSLCILLYPLVENA